MKRNSSLLLAFFVALSLTGPLNAQSKNQSAQEQSTFGGDEALGFPLIRRPVPVPGSVLQILKQDEFVHSCLSDNVPSPEAPFASWFVASEIHLDGSQEPDLIVLPSPHEHQPDYMCFHSAESFSQFWIFRPTSSRYQLILKTFGLGVKIGDARHYGYRDIESGSPMAGSVTTVTYRFDGKVYREYGKQTQESQ